MASHLIAVDVGNSRIKVGLFNAAGLRGDGLPTCRNAAAVSVDADVPWPDIVNWVSCGEPVHSVIAGANPRGVHKVLASWPTESWTPPISIEKPSDFPLRIKLPEPEKVGIDRLLNAVAANKCRAPGRPAVIVSSGTATTVDYVDSTGAFAGGAILPGFDLAARALHQYTALLPLVTMEELASEPHSPLGTDTRQALRSGLFWGQLGAARELILQYRGLADVSPQLFLTGGGAGLLAAHLTDARLEPHLALQGLALVAGELINRPDFRNPGVAVPADDLH